MSYNPLNVRKLKKIKPNSFSDEYFFEQLSMESGHIDKEIVRRVYQGMVKLLTKEMVNTGVIRAPHLGDFAITEKKESLVYAPGTKGARRPMTIKTIKFFANENWKKYFNAKRVFDQQNTDIL